MKFVCLYATRFLWKTNDESIDWSSYRIHLNFQNSQSPFPAVAVLVHRSHKRLCTVPLKIHLYRASRLYLTAYHCFIAFWTAFLCVAFNFSHVLLSIIFAVDLLSTIIFIHNGHPNTNPTFRHNQLSKHIHHWNFVFLYKMHVWN